MPDKQCLKCKKKESQSDFPFMSSYGLCNECHALFLPRITEALRKFLNNRKGSGKKSWITRRKYVRA